MTKKEREKNRIVRKTFRQGAELVLEGLDRKKPKLLRAGTVFCQVAMANMKGRG